MPLWKITRLAVMGVAPVTLGSVLSLFGFDAASHYTALLLLAGFALVSVALAYQTAKG